MEKYLAVAKLAELKNIYDENVFETDISLYSYEDKFKLPKLTILPQAKYKSCGFCIDDLSKMPMVINFFLGKSNYLRVMIRKRYLEEFEQYDILSQINYGNDFISILLSTENLNGLNISKNIEKFSAMTFFYENKIIGDCSFYDMRLSGTYRVEIPMNKKLDYDETIEIFYYYEIDNKKLGLKADFFMGLLDKFNMYMSLYRNKNEFMYFNFYNKTICILCSKESDIDAKINELCFRPFIINKSNNQNIFLLKSFDNGLGGQELLSEIIEIFDELFGKGE